MQAPNCLCLLRVCVDVLILRSGDPTRFGDQTLVSAGRHRNASNVASIVDPTGSEKGTLCLCQC